MTFLPDVLVYYGTLKGAREIFLSLAKKNNQLWGSFDFKGSEGKSLDINLPVDPPVNFVDMVRDGDGSPNSYAGNSQEFNEVGFAKCTEIDYKQFEDQWVGDANLTLVSPDYTFPIEVGNPPSGVGVVKKESNISK